MGTGHSGPPDAQPGGPVDDVATAGEAESAFWDGDRTWLVEGDADDSVPGSEVSEEVLWAAEAAALEEFGSTAPDAEDSTSPALPVVAVVGRPNVGKSTLVNRIIGRREAVVEDVPGVTRDRVTYEATWAGRDFVLLDTGGWERGAVGMAAQVTAQAERAINEADVVVFVVDATVGATDADEYVVPVLRRSRTPVVLAANKVDDARAEAEAATLWSLGLGEPFPVSALHGRGSGDLLDAVVAVLPERGKGNATPG